MDQITKVLKEETNAQFVKGPIFNFDKPYKAVFTKDSEFTKGNYPDITKTTFKTGDTILVTGAKPMGSAMSFSSLDSEESFETKAFGRPPFEVIDVDAFRAQVTTIKDSDWKEAEALAAMLDCGALESAGKPNFEKHHLTIGDTPVFFDLRLENDKVLIYFNLRTYGGEDFKDVGAAIKGESKLGLTFNKGEEVTLDCESDDDRFAIFDLTNYREQALSGISKVSFSLSKKEVSKELSDENVYAIGLKMECISN